MGEFCGANSLYSRCEPGSSCVLAPNGYNMCTAGTCSKSGEECGKVCCAGLECASWQGKRVCRPEAPKCAPPNQKGPCPGNGMMCCSMHCRDWTSQQFLAPAVHNSVCECSSPGLACMDDSYCCNGGKCTFGYVCQ